jgi:glc operon protein GlcG
MKKALALIAAGFCLVGAPAMAQTAAPPPAPAVHPAYSARVITLAEAKSVVAAAEAEARKNGWSMVITVVESNGALVLCEKMDGAQYGSIEVAQKKAQTAVNFRRPTSYFQDAVKAGTLNAIFTGAMALEGGELLLVDGKIVGAIGVSGGSAPQDGVVARAAAVTLK